MICWLIMLSDSAALNSTVFSSVRTLGSLCWQLVVRVKQPFRVYVLADVIPASPSHLVQKVSLPCSSALHLDLFLH